MAECKHFQFGLACFILAAFAGLAGFLVVYHYASSERPIQQFAIVVDAGSTQTRSSLFMINLDTDRLLDWTSELSEQDEITNNDDYQYDPEEHYFFQKLKRFHPHNEPKPLSSIIEVKQVSSCINGGPLSQLKNEDEAVVLIEKCARKFARHIKRLDFISSNEDRLIEDDYTKSLADDESSLDSDEMAQRLALFNHRVNSLTHIHLGATAGMRALSMINETKAAEKIHWVEQAVGQMNRKLSIKGPYINPGFVDIISGSDEAAFGWTSVNFVCEKLEAKHKHNHQHQIPSKNLQLETNKTAYKLDYELNNNNNNDQLSTSPYIRSIGTLELGGASAQIAYQVPRLIKQESIKNLSMEEHNLELFNGKYKLATRSDLCMGMSQAVLRVKYVLLIDYLNEFLEFESLENQLIKITNPCFQQASVTNLTASDFLDILKAPCLVGSVKNLRDSMKLEGFLNRTKSTIQFLGNGNTEQCRSLLSNLLDSNKCQKYFSLCPSEPEKLARPPKNMPFVTISGYNKALQVLNIKKKFDTSATTTTLSEEGDVDLIMREKIINDRLGGHSIDYLEFTDETRRFCSININDLAAKFPSMHKAYHSVNCLQLVYIDKLLIDFYKFDPLSTWNQIKFLLFPVNKQQQVLTPSNLKPNDSLKNDIGWSLGLLLNATSNQFLGIHTHEEFLSPDVKSSQELYYHHGASLVYIMRTTVFIMLACCLMAVSLLTIAIIGRNCLSQSTGHYEQSGWINNYRIDRGSYIDHSIDR